MGSCRVRRGSALLTLSWAQDVFSAVQDPVSLHVWCLHLFLLTHSTCKIWLIGRFYLLHISGKLFYLEGNTPSVRKKALFHCCNLRELSLEIQLLNISCHVTVTSPIEFASISIFLFRIVLKNEGLCLKCLLRIFYFYLFISLPLFLWSLGDCYWKTKAASWNDHGRHFREWFNRSLFFMQYP